jgi:hypothetical protein
MCDAIYLIIILYIWKCKNSAIRPKPQLPCMTQGASWLRVKCSSTSETKTLRPTPSRAGRSPGTTSASHFRKTSAKGSSIDTTGPLRKKIKSWVRIPPGSWIEWTCTTQLYAITCAVIGQTCGWAKGFESRRGVRRKEEQQKGAALFSVCQHSRPAF